jgi:flagellar M-ring protein FliF
LQIPAKTLFIDDSQTSKPSAAVTLTLDQELSQKQVNAVVDYVCKSVDGLTADNVSVMDSDLNPLYSKDSSNQNDSSVTSQIDIKNKATDRLRQQVEYMLANMGDNVKVGVNLAMDFDTSTIESTNYNGSNADNTGVLSKQQTTKKDGKGVEASGGAAGTDTNSTVTSYPSTSGGNNYQLKESTDNSEYLVDTKKTQTVKATGTTDYNKSSLAVVLYTKGKEYASQASYNAAKPVTKSRRDLLGIVRNGTGIQKVTITEVRVPQLKITQSFDAGKFLNSYGAFILAGLLILGLLIGLLRGTAKSKAEDAELASASETEVEVEDIDMSANNEKQKFDATVSDEDDVPEIDVKKASEIQKQINKFVREKPDAVAQLLRNWLNDDWE